MTRRNPKYATTGMKYATTGMALSVALAAALSVSQPWQTAQAQSLEDALVAAYLNNPALRAERASLRATDENVAQALSGWRPTIELSAATGRERNTSSARTGGSGGTQVRSPENYSLDLTQPLFRGGRTLAETSEAENTVLGDRARLTGVEQSTLLDAAVAYLDIVRDAAVLDLNINNEAVHVQQLEAARDRFQVGEITRTDVYQSEARLATATADRVQSETQLKASRSSYLNITGASAPDVLSMPSLPPGVPPGIEAAIAEALVGNPSVIAAQYDERAAADAVDAARGALLPEVAFTASTRRNLNAAGVSTKTESHEALISITVPLYQSGSVYARLRAAKQRVAQQRHHVEQARRNVTQEASVAWENLTSAEARVDSFRTAIEAARVAFDGVEREASVGSRTVLDVLDAEQELLDARVSYIRAQHDESVAIFQLLSAMGRLTARYMQLPVALYSPEEHYDEVRDKWFGGNSSGGQE